MFVLRPNQIFDLQDPPKLNRCTELLSMQEELKQARKAFEVDEEKLASTEWLGIGIVDG